MLIFERPCLYLTDHVDIRLNPPGSLHHLLILTLRLASSSRSPTFPAPSHIAINVSYTQRLSLTHTSLCGNTYTHMLASTGRHMVDNNNCRHLGSHKAAPGPDPNDPEQQTSYTIVKGAKGCCVSISKHTRYASMSSRPPQAKGLYS
jgi:hypothetical protein